MQEKESNKKRKFIKRGIQGLSSDTDVDFVRWCLLENNENMEESVDGKT